MHEGRAEIEGSRVLVVDSNVTGAHVLKRALRTLGCTVRIAHEGFSALQVAVEFRPEIVLLEIALPMLNGWEVARRLRTIPRFKPPRLIAVTGLADPVHRAQSLHMGFENHLVKPVALEELRRILAGPGSSS